MNLLAAGGLTIPPVALMLWVPLALGLNLRDDRACGRLRMVAGRWGAFSLSFASAALIGLFVGGVVVHDWRADAAIAQGRAAALRNPPDFDQARVAFLQAARLDPYDAVPWVEIANLEYRRWAEERMPTNTGIRDRLGVAFQGAITPPRDPNSLPLQRSRMELLRSILEERGAFFDTRTARRLRLDLLDAATRATQLYPTSARLRAERAEAAVAVDRYTEAARQAREALRLDATTPHLDKKLPKAVRERLQEAAPRWEATAQEAPS